jgi:esterase/lipase
MPQNNILLNDPHLTYPDRDKRLPFADYILQCQQLITMTRPDEGGVALAANSPYELKPAGTLKTGVLLIHGLYDSPFMLRDIGALLQAQGLLVRSVLLPGHGTVPGALLNIRFEDWLQTIGYGINSLENTVDKIILVGFSIGGAMALQALLEKTSNKLAAGILLAPALKVSALACVTNLFPKVGKDWLQIADEVDYAKYRSFTYESAYQAYRLTQKIAGMKPALRAPLLVSMSRNDQTVKSAATLDWFLQHASAKSELIYYSDKPTVADARITTRKVKYAELGITDISHICLPIAPENIHYGKSGDYVYASHADTKAIATNRYGAYSALLQDICNPLFKHGLIQQRFSRLTYNPDFAYLAERIQQFIQKISAS